MKLYYSPLSVYSAKPRIAMYEKGIAHETKLVNWTPATGWIKPDETVVLFNTGTGYKYSEAWERALAAGQI